MKNIYDNIIIGSGLTGLTIAKLLSSKKIDYIILDKNKDAGGRISTNNSTRYNLDEGFQILLEDYPNLGIFPEINNSSFKKFESGFITKKGNSLYKVLNPLKNIKGFFFDNSFPGFTLKDKYLLGKLIFLSKKYENQEIPVKNFLKDFGFSDTFINDFFISFFQGVFLDNNLNVPLKYFLFIFSLFSKSNVSIPINGMNQIVQEILLKLDSSKLKLNKEVVNIKADSIETDDGEIFYFKKLFCTDPQIEKLIDKRLNQNFFKRISYNSVQCFYFLADMIDVDDRFIYLFPESKNITNMCLKKLENDRFIISASSLCMEISENAIEKEISVYFDNIKNIKFLEAFKILNALPSNPKFFNFQKKSFYQYSSNIYFAGDYLSYPCLNGSIQSALNLVRSLSK